MDKLIITYHYLQIKNLEIASSENPSMLLVSGISCEAKAGEILAIMATAEGEATGLLNVLAGIGKVNIISLRQLGAYEQ